MPPFPPSLVSPSNNAFVSDNTPTFSWSSVLDAFYYILQLDTSPSFSSSDLITVSGITSTSYTLITSLFDDTWYWRVCVVDAANNQGAYSNTNIFSVDSTFPSIDHPKDICYNEGSTGYNITWNPSDDYPSSYTVTRDGVEVDGDSWSGGPIMVNVDGLSPGTYIYTCNVYDEAGNSVSDTVTVTVTEAKEEEEDERFPWLWAGIGLTVVVAVGLALLFLKKK